MALTLARISTAPGRAGAAFLVLTLAAGSITASDRQRTATPGPTAGIVAPVSCGLAAPAAAALVPEFQRTVADTAATLAYDGATLSLGPGAVAEPVPIGITPLTEAELPPLDAGMTNVTEGPRAGYRFTPHPFRFAAPVEVSIPYDPERVGASFGPQDVHTFFFEESTGCWRALERVRVDEEAHTVVSRTDHFTDMVNAVVTAPESPGATSFDPTMIKNLTTGDPGAGVNLVSVPGATHTGDARLSYPIEVPPGRAGLQPQLQMGYSSAGGNGWLGVGWDMAVPSITVDTRFGVPRYDGGLETETYLLGGRQLTPVAFRGTPVARTAEKVFHTRVEGEFARITRHGGSPRDYTWEVVDRSGNRSLYGGAAGSTLADGAGNVFQWALRELRDPHGNVIRFHSVTQEDAGVAGGTVPGRALYPQKITYTGDADSDGPYAITFIRDRELEEPRRPDVTIDARGGFKRVTADLLRRVEVTLDNLPIRAYELDYATGAFGKTLLRSITQFDENGRPFTTHTFGYHDDVRDSAGAYQAFDAVGWTSPDDQLADAQRQQRVGDHLFRRAEPVRRFTHLESLLAGPAAPRRTGSAGARCRWPFGDQERDRAVLHVDARVQRLAHQRLAALLGDEHGRAVLLDHVVAGDRLGGHRHVQRTVRGVAADPQAARRRVPVHDLPNDTGGGIGHDQHDDCSLRTRARAARTGRTMPSRLDVGRSVTCQ
ncbi:MULTISPECIES: SpvB/TcaC N-terminal domain-containing protein [Catenuloplanes]|uniref:Uncharacterized protein n=1 Tax=Catenuloplanes niger TaxID=587534 RepID=A0AAE3ZWY0_9ACTN|nr:SpvB/TcaC N-terminal domain-containing protein [Catenuloplanes niger]MDR7327543.1 hypothetical protein [Catenuloplanes niger]